MRTLRCLATALCAVLALSAIPPVTAEAQTADRACPEGRVPWGGFDDVARDDVHAFAVDCVVWWDVARGTAAHRYSPGSVVRRDHMASFVARIMEAAGYRLPSSPPRRFRDISQSAHAHRIDQLAAVGVVSGDGSGRYHPDATVTRGQMATFLVKAIEVTRGQRLSAGSRSYDDIASSPHATNIEKATAAGIATGTGQRRFAPGGPVTRAQMGSFSARSLDHLVRSGHGSPPAGPPQRGPEPFQEEQWGLQRVQGPAAWEVATGRRAVVAVVDTGVDRDHPELSGKLVRGASWVGCSGTTPCDAWDDANGHGTHVAGIVAAPRDDRGVTGVAPGALIMPVRVLDASGNGSGSDVAAGIRWATDNGAHVINLSLGQLPVVNQLTGTDGGFASAISYAAGQGVLVVAAAGNESSPICSSEAFRSGRAVCVGATDRRDLKSAYSNFGLGLDVVAPGGRPGFCAEAVLSTYATDRSSTCRDERGYDALAGTSMAAPHVAGTGALLVELGVTGERAARRIAATTDQLGLLGYDPVYGYGRVNAARAVRSP